MSKYIIRKIQYCSEKRWCVFKSSPPLKRTKEWRKIESAHKEWYQALAYANAYAKFDALVDGH